MTAPCLGDRIIHLRTGRMGKVVRVMRTSVRAKFYKDNYPETLSDGEYRMAGRWERVCHWFMRMVSRSY